MRVSASLPPPRSWSKLAAGAGGVGGHKMLSKSSTRRHCGGGKLQRGTTTVFLWLFRQCRQCAVKIAMRWVMCAHSSTFTNGPCRQRPALSLGTCTFSCSVSRELSAVVCAVTVCVSLHSGLMGSFASAPFARMALAANVLQYP